MLLVSERVNPLRIHNPYTRYSLWYSDSVVVAYDITTTTETAGFGCMRLCVVHCSSPRTQNLHK